MQHIKKYDDLVFDTRDFWSVVKNLFLKGIMPYSDSEAKMFALQLDFLTKLRYFMIHNWSNLDINFSPLSVEIKFENIEFPFHIKKGFSYPDSCIIDVEDASITFKKGTKTSITFLPQNKVKFLWDWLYDLRSQQMTIPGVSLPVLRRKDF